MYNWDEFSSASLKKCPLSNTPTAPQDLRTCLGQSPHLRDEDVRVRDLPKLLLLTAESCSIEPWFPDSQASALTLRVRVDGAIRRGSGVRGAGF